MPPTMQKTERVSLFGEKADDTRRPTSLPLVLPNNVKYDVQTGTVSRNAGEKRTHLEIVPSTVALLSKLTDPLAVVAIAGMARSGKSYILSRILGSSNAFRLGHSMDPETYGIWIGTEVLKTDKFTILLVDTEGIDAASAEKENDISLLVLTILLSSYFIFNTLSVPKQSQLEDLQCFVQLVNGLRVNREGSNDYNKFSQVFPDLLWLLRDVTLTPTDEKGKEIDARSFLLNRVLKPSDGFEEKPSDKVARALKTFFPSLDCITLPRPSEDAVIMQNIAASEEKLSQQFKDALPQAIDHIMKNMKPKTGYTRDSKVTGSQLCCMLETYVKAVNDPTTIPVIETCWQTSLRILAERFHNEAVEQYKKSMTAALEERGPEPLEAGGSGITLVSLHRKFYTLSQEHVTKGLGPMCNEVEHGKFLSRLQKDVFGSKGKNDQSGNPSGLFHQFWRINEAKSIAYCEKVRDDLWEPIAKKLGEKESSYTYEDLKQDLKNFEMEYRAKAKGPAKEKVYGAFLDHVKSEEKTFAKVQDFKQEEFVEKQKAADVASKLQEIEEEHRRVEAMMVEEMEEHKRQAIKLSEEFNEKRDKMKEEEKDAYLERMREQTELMQKTASENIQMLQELSSRNIKFLEESIKLTQEDAKQQQQQMIKMVHTVQEKNAKLAQDLAEQAKAQRKGPLSSIVEILPIFTKFFEVFRSLPKAKKNTATKTAGK